MKKVILIGLVFCILLGLVSIPLLYPVAKVVRSQQHLANALEANEAGDARRAHFKILSAYNLVKDDPAINALMGPYAAAVYDPNALKWWTAAAEEGLLDLEGLIEMVRYGLRTNQGDVVRPYLFQLNREHPDNPQMQALQVQFLQRERRLGETRALATELVGQGNLDLAVYSSYLESTFGQEDVAEADQKAALASLRETARQEGEIGIFSLRALLQLWDRLDDKEKELVERQLGTHGSARLEDQLRLLSLQRGDGADKETILEAAGVAYDAFKADDATRAPGSPAALSVLVNWLNREGYPETALRYLPEASKIKDPDLFFMRQAALIASGDPAAARDATYVENPLSPARNLITRAFAQAALGQPEKVRPNLELAADQVRIFEVQWLEQILLNAGAPDLVIRMYENVERQFNRPVSAQVRLLQYYYALQRELDVRRVVRDISLEQLSGLLSDQLTALYFLVLYHEDFPQVRRMAESLFARYPTLIEPRLYLAFCYALSGNPGAAPAFLGDYEGFNLQQNRSFAIMLAHIHLRTGEIEKARALVEAIPRESLLDQERVLLSGLL